MFSLILVLALALQPIQISSKLLKVSIFYEALCPDSVKFISKQFHPAYKKFSIPLKIHFVPYGRATHTLKNGEWFFECQHGMEECKGNMMQACGIAEEKGQDNTVEFVHCMMWHSHPGSVSALNMCVKHLNVTSQKIIDCVESSTGSNLLAKYGDETHALYPLKFIPTIIFDDKFDDFIQSSSINNFYDAVNQYLALNNEYDTTISSLNNAYKNSKNFSVVVLTIVTLIFNWY